MNITETSRLSAHPPFLVTDLFRLHGQSVGVVALQILTKK